MHVYFRKQLSERQTFVVDILKPWKVCVTIYHHLTIRQMNDFSFQCINIFFSPGTSIVPFSVEKLIVACLSAIWIYLCRKKIICTLVIQVALWQ